MSMSIDEHIDSQIKKLYHHLELLLAMKAGKTLQRKTSDGTWLTTMFIDLDVWEYRIKPDEHERTIWLNCYDSTTVAHNSAEEAHVRQTQGIIARKTITFTFVPGEFDE